MTSIQVGPPNLKTVDPAMLAVAKFLRGHPLLKQREGILGDRRYMFFKGTSFD